jgi:hypothetical protein
MRTAIGLLICAFMLASGTFVEQARAAGIANYWATVAGGGAVGQALGVTSGTRTATGTYEITFGRAVNTCAHTVTLRGPTKPGMAAASPKTGSNQVVVVGTFSKTGVKEDRAFNIKVDCK